MGDTGAAGKVHEPARAADIRLVSSTTIPPLRPTRALVALGAVAVASTVWFVVGVARPTPPLIGWLGVWLGAAIAAQQAWRAGRAGRTLWRYAGVCIALIGCGGAFNAYDYLSGNEQGQHISALTAAIYVSGLAVLLVGLLRIHGARRTRVEWLRFGLDIATVLVTVVTFASHLLYPRWEAWGAGDCEDRLAALIVIVAGLLCFFTFVKVAFTGTGLNDRRALHLLALVGGLGTAGGSLAPLLADRPYLNSAHLQLPWECLVLALAADRQRRAIRAGDPLPRPLTRRWSVMPYLAVVSTGALLLSSQVHKSPDGLLVAAGAVGVTLLVAARQAVALRDNAHQADHDALTGLANRQVLTRRTTDALARGTDRIGVALIDLDNFKAINDDLGHAVGDVLLAEVARRIEAVVPAGGVAARLGGDEYALMLPGRHEDVLASIIAELRRPVHALGHDLVVQASIGLAVADDEATAEELVRRADVAMYRAKAGGRGGHVVYHPGLDRPGAEQARLAADLRTALDAGDLHLLYQPIVAIADGSLVGVETLVRWTHPERGPVSPATFIPAAERTGLIVPLGQWILTRACEQAVRWHDELGPAAPRTVAVNVSARELREDGFAAEVAAVLARTGMPPSMLTVEVTETAVFDSAVSVAELHAVRALGVGVALDDFGTGHSSLSVLRTCPADVIKLDKSFVDNITDGGEEAVVAAALLQISDGLRLRAVAEGIETAAQAAELYRLGYRYAQGYHFGRPMPATEITRRQEALPAA
jgi:diguanylate cyclase (GGDEF)-like protein